MAGANGSRKQRKKKKTLSPQNIAVIAALLTGALKVESVLIDSDQCIEVLLQGSIRRKTKTDLLVEEISDINVGELLDAFLRSRDCE